MKILVNSVCTMIAFLIVITYKVQLDIPRTNIISDNECYDKLK
jgi:hypothetical protein